MDLEPGRREHNMARWTFAGAIGVVVGPLLLAAFVWVGLGWRELFALCALGALGLVLLLRRSPDAHDDEERPRLRDALRAVRSREVFRWLFLLELSDLLLDVFLGFLALYFVDEVGSSPASARARGRGLERRRARRRRRDDPAAAAGRRPALPARERGRDGRALRRLPRSFRAPS